MEIPSDLIAAATERRLIPFIGAGFSAPIGLPDWDSLLRQIAAEVEPSLTYEEIANYANDDHLQIAEYLYLKSNKKIGPLRHFIAKNLHHTGDITRSTSHVELVNLKAPQIYTTNYDELIEDSYRRLGVPYRAIALGRDVSEASGTATQIVKYHGDLRHEDTLVLTESSYYKRLDFDSPMDIKFRADLLGRSVLFMGYSFRDINIRIIWFKLNQMMMDIPAADRRQSYILRLKSNPVLEALYEAAGLKTIVLDPPDSEGGLGSPWSNRAGTGFAPITSTGALLATLANKVETADGGRDNAAPLFVSKMMIDEAHRESSANPLANISAVENIFERSIPYGLEEEAQNLTLSMLNKKPQTWKLSSNLILASQSIGPSEDLTWHVVRILLEDSTETFREDLLSSSSVSWGVVWSAPLKSGECEQVLERFEREIGYHRGAAGDMDLAFAIDLALRIKYQGLARPYDERRTRRIETLLMSAQALYPRVADVSPIRNGPPDPSWLKQELNDGIVRQRHLTKDPDEVYALKKRRSYDFVDPDDVINPASPIRPPK
ncbi:SIR2 family protein [Arthrobacter sp. ISL-65]|uniref:SIR2 family protein n=1 Tax=Arthrobacter sp. ISL-65 TaxID=2819112 RepID=UPI001BEC55D8|nr:SIR2 family protein [Arthrobacter sp. ISL-65]MBT2550992.1 SIR2 family protein [Arthrobacter sp. ISL-65]